MDTTWTTRLTRHVEKLPCAIIRLSEEECEGIASSRRRFKEFSLARPHGLVERLRVPTLCLLFGATGTRNYAYLVLAKSKQAVTTLDTRVKCRSGFAIVPDTEKNVAELLKKKALSTILAGALRSDDSVIQLTPKVSAALISILASQPPNQQGFRIVDDILSAPKSFSGSAALEQDAVQMALEAFGLSLASEALRVEVPDDKQSSLRRITLLEDAVIEHDARSIPGLDLIESDMTGRALFQKGGETLEVFTANKRPLEEVLGVDLVYLNLTRHNIAMVQYKMLESEGKGEWIYRPDKQLEKEMERMEKFSGKHLPGPLEYRLNPEAFYLKFVKRNSSIQQGGIILPIDHYKQILNDPRCARGKLDGLRINYESLGGRYLRDDAFQALVRSGYIGPYAATTEAFATLIRFIVDEGRAAVGAIAFPTPPEQVANSGQEPSAGTRAR